MYCPEIAIWKVLRFILHFNYKNRYYTNKSIRDVHKTTRPHTTMSQAGDKRERGFLAGIIPTKTWGVQNIEKAYSRAGASNNQTPGCASRLGSQDQAGGGHAHQGVGSTKFADSISDQRREVGSP